MGTYLWLPTSGYLPLVTYLCTIPHDTTSQVGHVAFNATGSLIATGGIDGMHCCCCCGSGGVRVVHVAVLRPVHGSHNP